MKLVEAKEGNVSGKVKLYIDKKVRKKYWTIVMKRMKKYERIYPAGVFGPQTHA